MGTIFDCKSHLLTAGLLLGLTCLKGQELPVVLYGSKEGLSQNYTSDILQDQEGFIWVGTKNGLNRFDGRRFNVFSIDPANPYAVSHDYITSLSEYGDFLLVGTYGGGLNLFHKRTQRFFRMPEAPPGGGRLEAPAIHRTAVDAQGAIWVVDWQTYSFGNLYRISTPPGFWERLPNSATPWEGVSIQKQSDFFIQRFFMNRKGSHLYYTKDSILAAVDTRTGQERLFPHKDIRPYSRINEDASGNIWVDANRAILKLGGLGFSSIPTDFPRSLTLFISQKNLAIFQTSEKELLLFDLSNPQRLIERESAVLRIDWPKYFRDAMVDRAGNLWLITGGTGLRKVNLLQGRFRTYFPNLSVSSPPFSTRSGGYGILDMSRQRFASTRPDNTDPFVGRQTLIPQLTFQTRYIKDREGTPWILHWDVAASQYFLLKIPATGAPIQLALESREGLMGNFSVDENGFIWIGLNGSLFKCDPTTLHIRKYDYRSVLPVSHEVRSIVQTERGVWWIGTSHGLVEVRSEKDDLSFRLLAQIPGDANSLRINDIACLLVDPHDSGVLWIGTKGGGLNRLDIRSGRFTHRTTQNGLPNNVIYGILAAEDGSLWMSSNKGLIRYNPESGQIRNYTAADGLQADEFNTWAYGISDAGEFMFGGINGLNVFDPKDFADNSNIPSIYITGLKINNRTVSPGDSTGVLKEAIEYTAQIRLPYSRNSIELEFAALEFAVPEKNRFRYYLEGAERMWAHESTDPRAQYLNLAPGHYTFKVIASNGDGVWNQTPATLQITILPPWYRSPLAYGLYGLLAGGLLLLFIRTRNRQWQLRHSLEMERLEAERIRELDQFKSRLFTNITHEFRTPLTVILGAGEQLEKRVPIELRDRVALILRNGRSLLDLANQLLDLAKAENNQLKLDRVQGDMVRYVRYITESFHSLANQRNLMLRVESQMPELVMDFDPEKTRQILTNLISNALKFTPSEGQIWVRMALEKDQTLRLEVADTGRGIAPEDLPNVFERFYQADNATTRAGGAGIGLALTRELVKLMDGDISVESTPGQGAVFTVRLPITRESREQAPDLLRQPERPALPIPAPAATDEAPTLLLIEDNPDVVEYLNLCLQGHYRMAFAYNGRAGIEHALDAVPDLILSDVMMPEKDGFEVCDILKHDERTSHIPIVLLTAKADVESRIAGLRRGADAYLAKPFHPEELLVTLEKLLESRRRLQARYALFGAEPPAQLQESPADTALEDAFVQKLRNALEERLGNPELGIEEICRAVGMSRSNLYAKLSALTGLSFNLYLRSLRLHKAKALLESSDMNVSEVAYEVGFSDPKYFSRVFSEQFGVAPSALRKQ